MRLGIEIKKARKDADFNPRTREGCDMIKYENAKARLISIHAPVKGATDSCRHILSNRRYFNPRTREGCDAGRIR